MMDNEILQLILQKLEGMDKRLDGMDKRMDALEQSVTDLRHALFQTEHNLNQEIKLSRDMLPLSMDAWRESMVMTAEVRAMLNDHASTKIAVDATLANHESRITGLEQKAG